MSTLTDLKAANKTAIRDKTAVGSATRANVADRLDAGLDFTAGVVPSAVQTAVLASGNTWDLKGELQGAQPANTAENMRFKDPAGYWLYWVIGGVWTRVAVG